MPISWTVLDDLVRLESEGVTTFEEWRVAVDAFGSDPRYRPGMGVIHRWSKGGPGLSMSEVEARSRYVARRAEWFGHTRWAVVVDRPVDYGMGRVAEALLRVEPGVEFCVFRDEAEAVAWVRGGPTPSAD